MRKLLTITALALSLAGCAQLQADYDALTGATVSPASVYIAANAFDAVEATATNYIKLPLCGSTGLATGAPCRSQTAVNLIVPAVRSGRLARNQLEAATFSPNATAPTPASAMTLLKGATTTLQQVLAEYGS